MGTETPRMHPHTHRVTRHRDLSGALPNGGVRQQTPERRCERDSFIRSHQYAGLAVIQTRWSSAHSRADDRQPDEGDGRACAMVAGLVSGGAWALANFVPPRPLAANQDYRIPRDHWRTGQEGRASARKLDTYRAPSHL
jgi:hypothetical protein